MNPVAKRLRARIAAAPKQGSGGRRYGAQLKRAVVEYAFTRQGEGATIGKIAGELGLSAGLLGKWLRHARLRLGNGRIPFAPGEPPPMPRRDQEAAAEFATAGSFASHAVRSGARRGPASDRGVARRQASTSQRIVIPAATLAEFLTRGVARYGSIRRAAVGIAVPYSTLRGWLRGRYSGAGNRALRTSMP